MEAKYNVSHFYEETPILLEFYVLLNFYITQSTRLHTTVHIWFYKSENILIHAFPSWELQPPRFVMGSYHMENLGCWLTPLGKSVHYRVIHIVFYPWY